MADKILKEAFDKLTAIEEDAEAANFDEYGICKVCNSSGKVDGKKCKACGGTGGDVEGQFKKDRVKEGISPEEAQINVLTLRMRRAVEDDDEAAYHRAVDQLNALTDKMNAEEPIEETRDDSSLHDAAIDLLDDMLANEQYSEKADVLRYAIKRLQEVGLGR